MKKKVSVGSYKTLSTDILPGGNVLDMDFNHLCLLVGMNGTGKTLILILTWLVNMTTFLWVNAKGKVPDLVKYVGYLFMKSFDRCDWTGYIEADYENLKLRIEIDRGVVTKVDFTEKDPNVELVSAAMPIFMSKETRLFTQINQYLKMKKMVGLGDMSTFTDADMDKITEMYKVYDIFFIERMVTRVSDPKFKVPQDILDKLNNMIINKKLVHISYDDIGCNFIIHEEKKDGSLFKYHATMLSAGEQSLVNMFVNNIP